MHLMRLLGQGSVHTEHYAEKRINLSPDWPSAYRILDATVGGCVQTACSWLEILWAMAFFEIAALVLQNECKYLSCNLLYSILITREKTRNRRWWMRSAFKS